MACAGWQIRPDHGDLFGKDGSHLERYASRLRAVEINTSFYRSHRRATYERWASCVPPGFRFAVKVPRTITHDRHLLGAGDELCRFLDEVAGLDGRLGPLLVQLPPSLELCDRDAHLFFGLLRERFAADVVCEPRHRTWLTAHAEQLLAGYQIARVAADPAPAPGAERPGAWRGVTYYRLHGSPEMYVSSYADTYLDELAADLEQAARNGQAWVVFDNTKYGAAAANALRVEEHLRPAAVMPARAKVPGKLPRVVARPSSV